MITNKQLVNEAASIGVWPNCCVETFKAIDNQLALRGSCNEFFALAIFWDMFGFALAGSIAERVQEIAINEVKSEIADDGGVPDLTSTVRNWGAVMRYPIWRTARAHAEQCKNKKKTRKFWLRFADLWYPGGK